MRLIRWFALISLWFASTAAHAEEALTLIGIPLGATLNFVTGALPDNRFSEKGRDEISGGVILSTRADNLDIEGLIQADFVFNGRPTLERVDLLFDKRRGRPNLFDALVYTLQKKFEVTQDWRHLDGDETVHFGGVGAQVTLESPPRSSFIAVHYVKRSYFEELVRRRDEASRAGFRELKK